jgi:hypothetical protein
LHHARNPGAIESVRNVTQVAPGMRIDPEKTTHNLLIYPIDITNTTFGHCSMRRKSGTLSATIITLWQPTLKVVACVTLLTACNTWRIHLISR